MIWIQYKEQKAKEARGKAYDAGIDWAAALMLQALHDMYGFGRGRFARMNRQWDAMLKENEGRCGYAKQWRDEMEEKYGFSRRKLEMFAQKMERAINGSRTCDKKKRAKTADMLAGTLLVMFYVLAKHYGFGRKRLQALQNKVMDLMRFVTSGDVPIYEFMECLHRECDVQFGCMDEYLKTHERPMIYG